MITLGIDTTGSYCSAALVDPARLIGMNSFKLSRGHAEYIGPQVQKLLLDATIAPAQISQIAVCVGPGSFTGLRVGIALAKGLALPRKTPIIGLSGLEIWAAALDPEGNRRILSIADVRRGEVFWQIFNNGLAQGNPELSNLEDAKRALEINLRAGHKVHVTGNGAALLGDYPAHDGYVNPAILAWSSLGKDPKSCPPAPLYHRPADAKLPGGLMPPSAF